MLEGPRRPNDPIHLADWLEMRALASADQNASTGDLTAVLQSMAAAEEIAVEELVDQALDEVVRRAELAGDSYPFDTASGVVSMRPGGRRHTAYLFCLFVSFFGHEQIKKRHPTCARLFEELARDALKGYVGGDGLRFGSPRKELPKGFRAGLNELCKKLGEGAGCAPGGLQWAKDGGLDVVAWKDFADRRPGRIVVFGQCACGENWREKTHELQVEEFITKYLERPPATRIVPAFFIPHQLAPDADAWRFIVTEAGIVFDRARLSRFAANEFERPEHEAVVADVLTAMEPKAAN